MINRENLDIASLLARATMIFLHDMMFSSCQGGRRRVALPFRGVEICAQEIFSDAPAYRSRLFFSP
jgi:hypothetical protein